MTGGQKLRAFAAMHIGAGRYDPADSTHPAFEIWRSLAIEFSRYVVVVRSTNRFDSTITIGNVEVYFLGSVFRSELEFLFLQFRALLIAKRVRPDVVLAQCPVQGGLVAGLIARFFGSGVMMEFHMAHYFERAPIFSKSFITQFLTRLSLRNADKIRVLSEGMLRALLQKFGDKYEARSFVLPPRVDISLFSEQKGTWSISGRAKVVLVGSVTPRKGQLAFLSLVLPSELDVEIWLVGDGPDLSACEALATGLGASERLRTFGFLDHEALARLLPKADILVLYSSMEGTPRALMEGMAVGLPVITTNAGFCADIVEDGVDGVVLGNDPSSQILKELGDLVIDVARREKLGKKAIASARAKFNATVLYDVYRREMSSTSRAVRK